MSDELTIKITDDTSCMRQRRWISHAKLGLLGADNSGPISKNKSTKRSILKARISAAEFSVPKYSKKNKVSLSQGQTSARSRSADGLSRSHLKESSGSLSRLTSGLNRPTSAGLSRSTSVLNHTAASSYRDKSLKSVPRKPKTLSSEADDKLKGRGVGRPAAAETARLRRIGHEAQLVREAAARRAEKEAVKKKLSELREKQRKILRNSVKRDANLDKPDWIGVLEEETGVRNENVSGAHKLLNPPKRSRPSPPLSQPLSEVSALTREFREEVRRATQDLRLSLPPRIVTDKSVQAEIVPEADPPIESWVRLSHEQFYQSFPEAEVPPENLRLSVDPNECSLRKYRNGLSDEIIPNDFRSLITKRINFSVLVQQPLSLVHEESVMANQGHRGSGEGSSQDRVKISRMTEDSKHVDARPLSRPSAELWDSSKGVCNSPKEDVCSQGCTSPKVTKELRRVISAEKINISRSPGRNKLRSEFSQTDLQKPVITADKEILVGRSPTLCHRETSPFSFENSPSRRLKTNGGTSNRVSSGRKHNIDSQGGSGDPTGFKLIRLSSENLFSDLGITNKVSVVENTSPISRNSSLPISDRLSDELSVTLNKNSDSNGKGSSLQGAQSPSEKEKHTIGSEEFVEMKFVGLEKFKLTEGDKLVTSQPDDLSPRELSCHQILNENIELTCRERSPNQSKYSQWDELDVYREEPVKELKKHSPKPLRETVETQWENIEAHSNLPSSCQSPHSSKEKSGHWEQLEAYQDPPLDISSKFPNTASGRSNELVKLESDLPRQREKLQSKENSSPSYAPNKSSSCSESYPRPFSSFQPSDLFSSPLGIIKNKLDFANLELDDVSVVGASSVSSRNSAEEKSITSIGAMEQPKKSVHDFLSGPENFSKLSIKMLENLLKEEELRFQEKVQVHNMKKNMLLQKMHNDLTTLSLERRDLKGKMKSKDEVLRSIKKRERGVILKLRQDFDAADKMLKEEKEASQMRKIILKRQINAIVLQKNANKLNFLPDRHKATSTVGLSRTQTVTVCENFDASKQGENFRAHAMNQLAYWNCQIAHEEKNLEHVERLISRCRCSGPECVDRGTSPPLFLPSDSSNTEERKPTAPVHKHRTKEVRRDFYEERMPFEVSLNKSCDFKVKKDDRDRRKTFVAIKEPLSPSVANRRGRRYSSGSDESAVYSHNEGSEASDMEIRVSWLQGELQRRHRELLDLQKLQSHSRGEHLTPLEQSLLLQISSYTAEIEKIKADLTNSTKVAKPQIKQPRANECLVRRSLSAGDGPSLVSVRVFHPSEFKDRVTNERTPTISPPASQSIIEDCVEAGEGSFESTHLSTAGSLEPKLDSIHTEDNGEIPSVSSIPEELPTAESHGEESVKTTIVESLNPAEDEDVSEDLTLKEVDSVKEVSEIISDHEDVQQVSEVYSEPASYLSTIQSEHSFINDNVSEGEIKSEVESVVSDNRSLKSYIESIESDVKSEIKSFVNDISLKSHIESVESDIKTEAKSVFSDNMSQKSTVELIENEKSEAESVVSDNTSLKHFLEAEETDMKSEVETVVSDSKSLKSVMESEESDAKSHMESIISDSKSPKSHVESLESDINSEVEIIDDKSLKCPMEVLESNDKIDEEFSPPHEESGVAEELELGVEASEVDLYKSAEESATSVIELKINENPVISENNTIMSPVSAEIYSDSDFNEEEIALSHTDNLEKNDQLSEVDSIKSSGVEMKVDVKSVDDYASIKSESDLSLKDPVSLKHDDQEENSEIIEKHSDNSGNVAEISDDSNVPSEIEMSSPKSKDGLKSPENDSEVIILEKEKAETELVKGDVNNYSENGQKELFELPDQIQIESINKNKEDFEILEEGVADESVESTSEAYLEVEEDIQDAEGEEEMFPNKIEEIPKDIEHLERQENLLELEKEKDISNEEKINSLEENIYEIPDSSIEADRSCGVEIIQHGLEESVSAALLSSLRAVGQIGDIEPSTSPKSEEKWKGDLCEYRKIREETPFLSALQRERVDAIAQELFNESYNEATSTVISVFLNNCPWNPSSIPDSDCDGKSEDFEAHDVTDSSQEDGLYHAKKVETVWKDKDTQKVLAEKEKLRLQQLRIEQEIECLEAEVLLRREVPCKPPPPYMPRGRGRAAGETAAAAAEALGFLWDGIDEPPSSWLPAAIAADTHMRMALWDMCAGLAAAAKLPPPLPIWLKPSTSVRLTPLPRSRSELITSGTSSVAAALAWSEDTSGNGNTKKRDRVDDILAAENAAEEIGWIDYAEEETNIKNSIVDSIFEDAISEAVSAIVKAFCSKLSQGQ